MDKLEQMGLVPRPLSIRETGGGFSVKKSCTVHAPACFERECTVFASQLKKNGFEIGVSVYSAAAPQKPAAVTLVSRDGFSEGAYELDVTENGISIAAKDGAGAFYGLQTVRQFFLGGAETIPGMHIEDRPKYSWRGLMLDTARNFAPVGFLEKLIDALSLHKMNRFHWHLTDDQGWRLPVDGYPLLTEVGSVWSDPRFPFNRLSKRRTWYTHEEIRRVVAYAADRHITVVPEIETPGHASALLAAYPDLGCTGGPYSVEGRFGIFPDVMCAGNDGVLTLLEAVFDTVVKLFPGPYIHIGGDECPHERWETCPKCLKRIAEHKLDGVSQLQSWVTSRVANMVAKHGKIPVGWDEVLDDSEKIGVPENLVVMSWRGIEGGIRAGKLGHKVIMAPQTGGCYLDYPHQDSFEEPGLHKYTTVEMSYKYSPTPQGFPAERADLILGGQGNTWAELLAYARWTEYMIFPRLCALSESLWLPDGHKDFASFSTRLETHKKRLDALDLLYYRGSLTKTGDSTGTC